MEHTQTAHSSVSPPHVPHMCSEAAWSTETLAPDPTSVALAYKLGGYMRRSRTPSGVTPQRPRAGPHGHSPLARSSPGVGQPSAPFRVAWRSPAGRRLRVSSEPFGGDSPCHGQPPWGISPARSACGPASRRVRIRRHRGEAQPRRILGSDHCRGPARCSSRSAGTIRPDDTSPVSQST